MLKLACADYLAVLFESPAAYRHLIDEVVAYLQPRAETFDAIAFRGMSGALVAPAVAAELDKAMIMVRKQGENTHSDEPVEGPTQAFRVLILDDFVALGKTTRAIRDGVLGLNAASTIVGIAEWQTIIDPQRFGGSQSVDDILVWTHREPPDDESREL